MKQTQKQQMQIDKEQEQDVMTEPKKATMKRPGLYADDLERMNTLMGQRNVMGTAAEVFSALLDAFVEETSTTQKQQIETVGRADSNPQLVHRAHQSSGAGARPASS
jgi:hypothetical protein